MARPVYIICSQSGTEDKITGLVSHFNVLEHLRISMIPATTSDEKVIMQMFEFRVTAVWMRSHDDSPDQEYEFKIVFHIPPDNREQIAQEGKFFFGTDKPLHRFTILGSGPPFSGSGLFRIESKIRRVGDDTWLSQDYPIEVEMIPPEVLNTDHKQQQ